MNTDNLNIAFFRGPAVLAAALLISLTFAQAGEARDNGNPQVWALKFDGNEQFSNMVLRNIIATEAPSFFRRLRFWNRQGFEYVQNEVRRDAIRIERYYQRRGYTHARVTFEVEEGRREWRRAVTFFIHEGPPTLIEDVVYEIEGEDEIRTLLEADRRFRQTRERQTLREGQRYQLIRHSDVEGMFMNSLNNMGFAFARAGVDAVVDTAANTATVYILLDPGPVARFGALNVEGAQTVSPEYVIRESDIRPGEQFSQTKLRNAQQQIFSHHLFRFATITMPSQPRDTTVDINIRVREHRLRSIRLLAGVGIEEIVRADLSWQHRNVFGLGHSFSIRGRTSYLEQSANVDYLFPYVFNTYSSITLSPFLQRLDEQNYVVYRSGINNSFLYQYSMELVGTVAYEYTRNEEIIRNPDAMLEDQLYDISALQLSGIFSQSPGDRPWGWAIRPYAEFSGFFGTGALRYQRFNLDVRRYINLRPRLQLALRTEGGVLFTEDEMILPAHIRFYAGGTGSVRGWARRQLGPKIPVFEEGDFVHFVPVGGRSMLNFNVEFRKDLRRFFNNLGAAVFLDSGQVWRRVGLTDLNDLQYGIGGGFRYQSPVGPIRIDAGYKLNPTSADLRRYEGIDLGPPLNRWAIHFSIGQAF